MNDYIKLVFKTDLKKTISLRINNPQALITDEAVDAAMDQIVASTALKSEAGRAVAKSSASLVSYKKTPITITA